MLTSRRVYADGDPPENYGYSARQSFSYDESDRLTSFVQYKVEDAIDAPIAMTASREWALDEQGNWKEYRLEHGGATHAPTIGSVNEYTTWVPAGGGPTESRTYDPSRSFLAEVDVDGTATRRRRTTHWAG
jgi:hypothetical protein